MALAEWLRSKVLSLEAPGSNSGYCRFFPGFFLHFFTPAVTILLKYLDPEITPTLFLLYNSSAEILLTFQLSKGTSTIIHQCTQRFSNYFYKWLTL